MSLNSDSGIHQVYVDS